MNRASRHTIENVIESLGILLLDGDEEESTVVDILRDCAIDLDMIADDIEKGVGWE